MIETVKGNLGSGSKETQAFKDPKKRPNYVDMSGNIKDNFVVRIGHFQDHQRKTRSLFAQTDIGESRWWGWHSLEDQNGFRTAEKRPAVQTLCELMAKLFQDEIVEKVQAKPIEGVQIVKDFGEDKAIFDSNLTSREFSDILNELGFSIEYYRSSDKPRITSARIMRK